MGKVRLVPKGIIFKKIAFDRNYDGKKNQSMLSQQSFFFINRCADNDMENFARGEYVNIK